MTVPDAGLPAGTISTALAYAAVAGRALGCTADPAAVASHVLLPRLDGSPSEGAAPVACPGGWVHADLIDDDRETFERLLGLHPTAGPEEVAREAQVWRLPVTPYRRGLPACAPPVFGTAGPRRIDRVVDLSTMWAGPLCTRLLADLGAEVTKIDPEARPDGFRDRPNLYRVLNRGKSIVDLDLRGAEDRARFEALVGEADVVVSSFSPRVMANFGYSPRELRSRRPDLVTVTITAFPARSAEAEWVSYGSGVHAASGLAMVSGEPAAAAVSYPDPLAGLAAFAAAVTAPIGADVTVSLASAISGLRPGRLDLDPCVADLDPQPGSIWL